ncbi:hypothetical protein VTJ49DRAFT_3420 [Mycothermus thermophilus]|uniref:TIL domain-containing protein n=1 Tax=Humicola insolens TaxID=85995 RepID=A0ABR3V7N3_HUMIN
MKLLTLLVSVGLIATAQAGCLYDCRVQCGKGPGAPADYCPMECISRCLGSKCPGQYKYDRSIC